MRKLGRMGRDDESGRQGSGLSGRVGRGLWILRSVGYLVSRQLQSFLGVEIR